MFRLLLKSAVELCGEWCCSTVHYRVPSLPVRRVVFVIMVISSLAFYAMAYRVPAVSYEMTYMGA